MPEEKQAVEILIGSSGGPHIAIRPLWRCHPGQQDYWDGNWIESEIQVSAGAFRGRFRASLRSEEFESFRRELQVLMSSLRGEASFATIEGQLALELQGDDKGHVHVEGTALDEAGIGNKLTFAFEIDQNILGHDPRLRLTLFW